jgi:hypothetical protein
MGNAWFFSAPAANQKASISYIVGKRTGASTQMLVNDLCARIPNRPQITADGYDPYVGAIGGAFGVDVDFAIIEKQYQPHFTGDAPRTTTCAACMRRFGRLH